MIPNKDDANIDAFYSLVLDWTLRDLSKGCMALNLLAAILMIVYATTIMAYQT